MIVESLLQSADRQNMFKTMPFIYQDKEYAFYAHHKSISKQKIEEIFTLFTDKNDMYNKLSVMAMETLNTLFEESNSKNAIKWKASF